MRDALAITLCAAFLAAGQPARSQQTSKPKSPPQTVAQHFEVSITGVRIASEWSMMPGMPGAPTVRANPGEQLVIVEFAAKDLRTGKVDTDASFSSFELEDASGETFPCSIQSTDVREIPFSVKNPAGLKTFRIGGVAFDIGPLVKSIKAAK